MKKKETTDEALKTYHSSHLGLYFYGALVGIITGFVVVAYRVSLSFGQVYRKHLYELVKNNYFDFKIMGSFILGIILLSLILGYIVVKYPMVKGSGIPQVKGVLIRKMEFSWFRELVAKFIGGVLAIGSGMSLGREGPSVQLGAEIGAGVFKVFKRKPFDKKYLVSCGASAGLAAAFGAPISGAIFAVEELHKFMSPLLITCVLISSVCAEFISKYFLGFQPTFTIKVNTYYNLRHYALIIIFAIIITIIGKLFQMALTKGQDIYKSIKISPILKPFIVVFITVFMGIFFFALTGGGHSLAEELLHMPFSYKALALLFVLKFLFTISCYSSGIPGGIFLPLLVLGAIAGKMYGMFVISFFSGITPGYEVYFIVLGMAALLTAVVKAPLTSTLLMLEMTGSFSHFFPLVTVCMVTFLLTEVIKMKPIYDTLLERMVPKELSEDGDEEKKMTIKIPVGLDCSISDRQIKEIAWPHNCLMVNIERGEKGIIPRGETTILSGDVLVFLTDEKTARNTKSILIHMGEK